MNAEELFKCDTCGRLYSEFEFVETIEEMLCERCASGIEDEEVYFDGIAEGYDDEYDYDNSDQ